MMDKIPIVKANDPEGWFDCVWAAIERANLTETEHEEVATAMAWIKETSDA